VNEFKIENYKTVKKWLLSGRGEHRFEASEEANNIECLKLCCMYTGKTPDELASCESIEKERETVAIALRETGLKILDIAKRIGILNNFWIHNGRDVMGTYRGWVLTQIS
jgi:hypothetical protein